MKLSGFSDEAGVSMEQQVDATRRLGWSYLDLRKVNGVHLYQLPMDQVHRLAELLAVNKLSVACAGSCIANWSRGIDEPIDKDLAEMDALLPRMKILRIPAVRVMSYAPLGKDWFAPQQRVEERLERLRKILSFFAAEGIVALHENCNNYGGMGWRHTLEIIQSLPGLKLVFDTGNPVISPDVASGDPGCRQCPWEFYRKVRGHIAAVHIKDPQWQEDPSGAGSDKVYQFPGEGDAQVQRIITDLVATGFDGVVSIEPHLSKPSPGEVGEEEARIRQYVDYGRRLEAIIDQARKSRV